MVFAVTAAVVGGAIGKSNQKKAYERSKRDADLQKLIDGSSPSILAAEGVDAESFQVAGTEVADIDKAIEQSYYGGEPPSEEILAVPEEVPAEELAMLLQSNPELFQDQGIMGMASGGAVGTPEDVYYFGVPQIMGMMQDPNPQIQGVGMQLADQMETMPDAGMVPATANQIQTMAMGGAVTAKKFEDGGPSRDGITQSLLDSTNRFGIGEETTYTVDSDSEQIGDGTQLIRTVTKITGREPRDEEEAKIIFDQLLRQNQLSDVVGELSERLPGYNRSRSAADNPDSIDFQRDPREYEVSGITELINRSKANGGPITSERLNQLRRR